MPSHGTVGRPMVAAAAVLILLSLRLPFLPPTLEDVDSVNFDLGVHDYNPALHRPHPPGYPVYIALAKASHALIADHATALAALFSALAVFPLYVLMTQVTTPAGALLACVFTLFSPLLWFNSVRPMSDLVGFCAVTAAQALLLTSRAAAPARWYVVAFLCGGVAGIRIQSLLLTLPLLGYVTVRDRRPRAHTAASVAAGAAAWAIPMIVLMGGPQSAAASFGLVVHDTVNQDSLVPQWTLHTAAVAARDVLVGPWQDPLLSAALIGLALTGAITLARTAPRRLMLALVLFGPYVVFHYAVQDTGTIRYTIPSIPLFALLASVPVTQWRVRRVAVPVAALAFVAAASATTLPALQAYGATPSPMMQAVDAVAARAEGQHVVVSGHFAFERYLPLLPDRLERLPLGHLKEWQSLTEYWRDGRRDPVLFLRESHRTDFLQFGRDTQTIVGHWEWPSALRSLLKAARPGNIDLVRLDPPRWMIESGAFVTDEAGPYQRVTREPHRLHVHPARVPQALIVSGTVDGARRPVDVSLRYGDTLRRFWRVDGFFTLHALLPPVTTERYVPVSLAAEAPLAITDVWVTDAAQPAIRPARGFHLAERDREGRVFRWAASDAHAIAYVPGDTAVLTIEGWLPLDYYDGATTVTLRWNDRPLATVAVAGPRLYHQLRVRRADGNPWNELTIATSHSFVPDNRTRNGDRRVLSLRIYELRLE